MSASGCRRQGDGGAPSHDHTMGVGEAVGALHNPFGARGARTSSRRQEHGGILAEAVGSPPCGPARAAACPGQVWARGRCRRCHARGHTALPGAARRLRGQSDWRVCVYGGVIDSGRVCLRPAPWTCGGRAVVVGSPPRPDAGGTCVLHVLWCRRIRALPHTLTDVCKCWWHFRVQWLARPAIWGATCPAGKAVP